MAIMMTTGYLVEILEIKRDKSGEDVFNLDNNEPFVSCRDPRLHGRLNDKQIHKYDTWPTLGLCELLR